MPRYTHPVDDMVFACPNCDGTAIWRRVDRSQSAGPDKPLACYDCDSRFDRAVIRQQKITRAGHGRHNMPDHIKEIIQTERAE